ncbi:MAG: hypothetical protein J5382_00155 [Bacteroidales bacterium]|nr:hypothetical protein [Bacteroidales bacterium]
MNRIFKFSVMAVAAILAFSGCQHEEISTDQYSDGSLALSAFSPNPVYRGGEITIIGSNLDQVSQVIVPGVEPITNFTVSGSGRECKLVFTVPVDGPVEGVIAIVGKDGTKIQSLAELTYTEPIVFTSFSPAAAMPGDVLTIKGDYLNLVMEVIFEGGAYVTDFVSQSRYELKVAVPSKAISGRLIVGDSDEVLDPDKVANKVYSEDELVIGDPTVSGLEVSVAKPGEDAVISGEYLDMVQKVVFADGVEVTDFTVSSDGTTLTVAIPATAKTGDVVAVDYAGKEFTAGSISLVQPGALIASPDPVKAGEDLTISGDDLDVVTTVTFPGAGEGSFYYDEDKGIVTTVPATATEGDITLGMANGDAVSVTYTLVHPTVTEVAPTELMAGGEIIVKGTDLDLVSKATLGGKEVGVEFADDVLKLLTSNTSVSGKIVLTLANGETVEPEETITLSYDSFIIVNELPAAEHIGALVTMKGENFMMIENIFIGEQKVTGYVKREDGEIQFTMPYNKVGVYPVYFDLFNGDRETCPSSIEVQLEQNITVIWEGYEDMGSWSNQPYLGDEKAFVNAGLLVGDKVRVYYSPLAEWYQIQVFGGHWDGMSFEELGWSNTISPDTIPSYCGYFEFTVTPTILGQLCNPQNWGGALLTQGEGAAVTMVTMIHEIPQEKTLWEGSEDLGSWSNQPYFGAEGALVEMGVKVGDLMRIYFTPTAEWWQIQIFDGHWGAVSIDEIGGGQTANPDTTTATNCLEFVLTEALYNQFTGIQGWGGTLLCQGESAIITRIAIL